MYQDKKDNAQGHHAFNLEVYYLGPCIFTLHEGLQTLGGS